MKVDVYMPWYIGDYDRDTAHLSFEEHGFYGAILRALWMRDGILDGRDRPRLARVLRTDVATVDRLWPAVEEFLSFNEDGTFTQKRLSSELEKAKGLRVAASKAGQASAAARRQPTTVVTEPPTEHTTDVQRPLQREPQRDASRKSNPSESPSPSGSGSESPSPRSGGWTGHDWKNRFGVASTNRTGKFYGNVGDAKASGQLSDLLDQVPAAERTEAESLAPQMFTLFFADPDKAVVNAGFPFSFFVHRWNALRLAAAPARAEPSRALPKIPMPPPNARQLAREMEAAEQAKQ